MIKKIIFPAIVLIFSTSIIAYYVINRGTHNIFTISQKNIDEIVERFDNGSLTKYDKRTIDRIYGNMIFFGGLIYPEASKILKHYIRGNGDDLEIISNYFFESKIIVEKIKVNNRKELIGPVTLKIRDNPRVAYAVNGFFIKNSDQMEIYQKINFASRDDRNTYTVFNLSILNLSIKEIKIPDRLIRKFEANGGCKEFTVRIKNKK
jgi:hypothetical protein